MKYYTADSIIVFIYCDDIINRIFQIELTILHSFRIAIVVLSLYILKLFRPPPPPLPPPPKKMTPPENMSPPKNMTPPKKMTLPKNMTSPKK